MTGQYQRSTLTTIAKLNETPLSQHLKSLLKAEKADLSPDGLIIQQALVWAMENREENHHWAAAVINAAGLAELDDPAGTYRNLAESEPELMRAQTMQEAASALISLVQCLITPDMRAA